MKRLIIILALALVPFCAKAQLLVGGNLGITYNSEKVGVYIAPEVGYSFNRWVMVGGLVSYESIRNSVGFDPYVRGNFGYIKNVVNFFVELAAPMNWADGYQCYQAVAIPGIVVRASPHVAFVLHVGAFGYYFVEEHGRTYDGWQARVDGNTIKLGCYFNF